MAPITYTPSARPVFSHDCDRCSFLGHVEGVDHHFCVDSDELIQRRSDEPIDYSALTVSMAKAVSKAGNAWWVDSLELKRQHDQYMFDVMWSLQNRRANRK